MINDRLLEETRRLLPSRLYVDEGRYWHGQYGAFTVAALYTGLSAEPAERWGEWQHGWKHPLENVHPEWVVGGSGRTRSRLSWRNRLWVFRRDQQEFLSLHGFSPVRAIGSPMVYLKAPKVDRLQASLLVMPPHSTVEVQARWDARQYIDYVASLKSKFEWIAACVTPVCIAQGSWVSELGEIGVPVIEGAEINDLNSLERMAVLFSRFEYVTMPLRGSQLAYAAFWGASPSIAGPAPPITTHERANATIYRNAPELLPIAERFSRLDVLKEMVSEFFVEPSCARPAVEWGRWQLGHDCRLSPKELKKELRWTWTWRAAGVTRRMRRLLRRRN